MRYTPILAENLFLSELADPSSTVAPEMSDTCQDLRVWRGSPPKSANTGMHPTFGYCSRPFEAEYCVAVVDIAESEVLLASMSEGNRLPPYVL